MKVRLFSLLIISGLLFAPLMNAESNYGFFDTTPLKIQKRIDSANISAFLLRSSHPDSSFSLASKALVASQIWSYQKGMADSYVNIGIYYKNKNLLNESLTSYKKAEAIRTKLNDYDGLSKVYNNLGSVYKKLTDYEMALQFYFKSLSMKEKENKEKETAGTMRNISNVYDLQGDFDKALYYINESKRIAEKYSDTPAIADAYFDLGKIYLSRSGYTKGLENFRISFQLYTNTGNASQIAGTMANMSLCYKGMGKIDSALLLQLEGLAIRKNLGFSDDLAESYLNLGDIFMDKNDSKNAFLNYDTATALFEENKIADGLKECYFSLSNAYQKIGMYDSALFYKNKYITIEDSIFNEKKYLINEEIEGKYQNQINLVKYQQLSTQNKNITLQSRLYLIIALSLIILLLIGLFIFFQQRRLTRRKAQLQQQHIESLLTDQELKSMNAMIEGQEEERKRIAEDLHDRVGSILSTVKLYFNALDNKVDNYQEENRTQYVKATNLLDEAVQEVRRISHNLISGILMKFGLAPALKDLCETVDGTDKIKTNLFLHGLDERMETQTEISVYRIIQELISNTLKHAKASEIDIHVTRRDGNLNILVEDNGQGFDTREKHDGIGLKNIRSRVDKLNGSITIESIKNKGTTVNIDIPIQNLAL